MFPRKLAAFLILAILICNITLITAIKPAQGQLFVDNLIEINPLDISISYNTDFSLNVTNLLDEPVWVFCLADANITRVDAPVFLTINATESYLFKFTSPQQPTNFDYNTSLTYSPTYSVYFGAVDSSATSFQTNQIILTMTSFDSLTLQISQLYTQNQQLMKEILKLTDRASMNNVLIILTVVSNIFWLCVLVAMKLSKPRNAPDNSEIPSPPHS